jgi:hypothetical protein
VPYLKSNRDILSHPVVFKALKNDLKIIQKSFVNTELSISFFCCWYWNQKVLSISASLRITQGYKFINRVVVHVPPSHLYFFSFSRAGSEPRIFWLLSIALPLSCSGSPTYLYFALIRIVSILPKVLHFKVLPHLVLYSQHLVFFVTNEWTQ